MLTIFLATGVVYVLWDDAGLKVRVDSDKTTFYVLEESRWRVSGREINSLWDGSSKLNRDLANTVVTTFYDLERNTSRVIRTTAYQRGSTIVDTYVFDGDNTDVTLFPVNHTIEIYNGEGFIYQYEVRDLVYTGSTIKNVDSPQSFGRSMKVRWDEGSYWNTLYKSGILKVRWRIDTDYVVLSNRLFDPNCGGATNCSCGDTLTDNFTLTGNVDGCTSSGLVIGANNVVLDCDGFLFQGDVSSSAIFSNAYTGITIKNCYFDNFSNGINIQKANLSNYTHNVISNITGDCIIAQHGWYLNVRDSTFYNCSDDAIILNNITYANLTNNTVNISGAELLQVDQRSSFIDVDNCTFLNGNRVLVYRARNVNVSNSYASNCTQTDAGCFNCDQSNFTNFVNNTATNFKRSGVMYAECISGVVKDNNISCTAGSFDCVAGVSLNAIHILVDNNIIVFAGS